MWAEWKPILQMKRWLEGERGSDLKVMALCRNQRHWLLFAFSLRYESLVESMRKKFAKKRNRSTITKSEEDVNCNVDDNQPKKAFLKPQDWEILFTHLPLYIDVYFYALEIFFRFILFLCLKTITLHCICCIVRRPTYGKGTSVWICMTILMYTFSQLNVPT